MNSDSLYGGFSAARSYSLPKFSTLNGWSLKARIHHPGGTVDIAAENATGSGTNWTLTIPPASLEEIDTGHITLILIAVSSTTEQVAHREGLQFIAATETDLRTPAEKTLEAIEALLQGKATQDQSSVSYNGRSISRFSWEELQNARDRIRREIKQQNERAAGKPKIKSVFQRFTND